MKKKIFLLMSICLIGTIKAQVGINTTTPHPSAALEISSTNGGLLIPRMTSLQRRSIPLPAPGLMIYDTTFKTIYLNAGKSTRPSWELVSGFDTEIQLGSFYMPSISIDASEVVVGKSINLYEEYKKQFQTPPIVSEGAPASIPYFMQASQLYYYITDYDSNVLKITKLTRDGELYYNILKESDFATFIDVILAVKK